MTYDIYGWVEVAKNHDSATVWTGALDLGEFVGYPDEFSSSAFGLSKFVDRPSAAFLERGVPSDCSTKMKDELEAISSFEREEGSDVGFHGYTYATLAELKETSLVPSSSWSSLLLKVSAIQKQGGYSDQAVRFIVWAQW